MPKATKDSIQYDVNVCEISAVGINENLPGFSGWLKRHGYNADNCTLSTYATTKAGALGNIITLIDQHKNAPDYLRLYQEKITEDELYLNRVVKEHMEKRSPVVESVLKALEQQRAEEAKRPKQSYMF
jgi:hypothetical protein